MKVLLKQEAVFDLAVDKCTAIPFNTFLAMTGSKENDNDIVNTLPEVRLFKSIDEFRDEYANHGSKYADADVYVMSDGRFCVFQRPFPAESDKGQSTSDNTTQTTDGTTNTQKGQGK